MSTILRQVRRELKENATLEARATGQTFFKGKVKLHGVKAPAVRKVAKSYFRQIKKLNKAEVFALCELLWQSGYLEESAIAGEWAYRLRDQFKPSDFRAMVRWVKQYVTN